MIDNLNRRQFLVLAGGALEAALVACRSTNPSATPDNSQPKPISLPRPGTASIEQEKQTTATSKLQAKPESLPSPTLPSKVDINPKLEEYNKLLNSDHQDAPRIVIPKLLELAAQLYVSRFVNTSIEQMAIHQRLTAAPEVLTTSAFVNLISRDPRCLPTTPFSFVPLFEDLMVINQDLLWTDFQGNPTTIPATLAFIYSLQTIQQIIPVPQPLPRGESFKLLSGRQVPAEMVRGFAVYGHDTENSKCSTVSSQKLDQTVISDSTSRMVEGLGIPTLTLLSGIEKINLDKYRAQVLDKFFPGEGYKLVLQLHRHSQRSDFTQIIGSKIPGRKHPDPFFAGYDYLRGLFG